MMDVEFDGVPVRLYQPIQSVRSGRGILYMHGGGWAFGSTSKITRYILFGEL